MLTSDVEDLYSTQEETRYKDVPPCILCSFKWHHSTDVEVLACYYQAAIPASIIPVVQYALDHILTSPNSATSPVLQCAKLSGAFMP